MADKLKQAEITSLELSQCQARNNTLRKIEVEISEKQYIRELVIQDNISYCKKLGEKYNLEEADDYIIDNGMLKPNIKEVTPAQPPTQNRK